MFDRTWMSRYESKVLTACDAVRKIPAGNRILIGSGAAEPVTLVNGLAEYGEHLADNDIVHLLTLGSAPYVRPEFSGRFRHSAFFIGPNVREAVQAGRADFTPVFLSEIPRMIRSRRSRIDVALLQVAPPDTRGYVSLGVSVDIVRAAVDAADLVIAEVNPLMPRTFGDSFVSIQDIDWLVPVETPILELATEPLDDVSLAIGRHVAGLVPNGATLQTGIGKIPHAVMSALRNHHDLGIHTEMLSDSAIDLVLAGVITGRRKTLLPQKLVTSFVMGTRRLYDWIHDNPAVELRPSDFTNDPFVIAQNERMVAINSALAVDLTGQVAADTVGGRFFSGIGGQVDFIRGAARSLHGKPIIALPSTAKGGTVSRIQTVLDAGAGIVTSRGDVHWVVTEYGAADLWGKNVRQRAAALIEIAHPDFRAGLVAEAKARKYVLPDQRLPRVPSRSEAPRKLELGSGSAICVRLIRLSDEEPLRAMLYRLSADSRYQRFHAHVPVPCHEELLRWVDVDQGSGVALVATTTTEAGEEVIGIARYDVDKASGRADVSVVVADAWQNRGVGTLLFRRIADVARERGVAGFYADVLANNKRMLAIFNNSGMWVETRLEQGTYHVNMSFPQDPADGSPAPTGTSLGLWAPPPLPK